VPLTPESSAWGFAEWAVTGLGSIGAAAIAFTWRLTFRMENMAMAIRQQRRDHETSQTSVDDALLRLAEKLAQLHDDYYRLRETIGALPDRTDLRELESRMSERLDALAARFDRALEAQHGA
jgi:septal ring factor EnvC (AmiA/AmiB activator)